MYFKYQHIHRDNVCLVSLVLVTFVIKKKDLSPMLLINDQKNELTTTPLCYHSERKLLDVILRYSIFWY